MTESANSPVDPAERGPEHDIVEAQVVILLTVKVEPIGTVLNPENIEWI